MPNSVKLVPFDLRIHDWVSRVEASQPCNNRKSAHDLIMNLWTELNLRKGVPEDLVQELRMRKLCSEHGWHGLGTDVAYADFAADFTVRVYLHVDGSIVIQSIGLDVQQILGVLPAGLKDKMELVQHNKQVT